jgi:HEAT repeats
VRPVLLLGAGFSAAFGVPTMLPFYEDFVAFARQRYPNLRATLEEVLAGLPTGPDIEALLSALNDAERAGVGVPPDVASDSRLTEWVGQARAIRAHLLAYIVERCELFDRDRAVDSAGPLVDALSQSGGAVFTTNYDRIVEYICEARACAFADGFDMSPGETASAWSGEFGAGLALVKLHGSVTWYERRDSSASFLRLDRGYPLPGPDFHLSRAGEELNNLMIVPTLEKDALRRPYSHLLLRFNDALATTRLLIVVGSSLRDEHLVSTITYRGQDLVVLVIGRSASDAARRLGDARVVVLNAATEPFLRVGSRPLAQFIDELDAGLTAAEVQAATEAFARDLEARVSEWLALTDEQRALIAQLDDEDWVVQLASLRGLRGIAHPAVVQKVLGLITSENRDVRVAAAGALGLARANDSVDRLLDLAVSDEDAGVRLEAALALREIGTAAAQTALEQRAERRPDDGFIASALAPVAGA